MSNVKIYKSLIECENQHGFIFRLCPTYIHHIDCDNYENGFTGYGETMFREINDHIYSCSISFLICKAAEHIYKFKLNDMTLDICEENGRLEFSFLSKCKKYTNIPIANKTTINKWKDGVLDLYHHEISFMIEGSIDGDKYHQLKLSKYFDVEKLISLGVSIGG